MLDRLAGEQVDDRLGIQNQAILVDYPRGKADALAQTLAMQANAVGSFWRGSCVALVS